MHERVTCLSPVGAYFVLRSEISRVWLDEYRLDRVMVRDIVWVWAMVNAKGYC